MVDLFFNVIDKIFVCFLLLPSNIFEFIRTYVISLIVKWAIINVINPLVIIFSFFDCFYDKLCYFHNCEFII